jgi:hypothetical protein
VSYRQKFSDSSHKAHTRFIATKIYQDMEKHRASVETSPTTSRRWVWELIQNAKDVSIDGKVRVRIDADLEDPDAHVTFKHNGSAFTTENIRLLIEQVSSGRGLSCAFSNVEVMTLGKLGEFMYTPS